jgi:hypothetical protein
MNNSIDNDQLTQYLQENLKGHNIVFEELDNGGFYVRNWDAQIRTQ